MIVFVNYLSFLPAPSKNKHFAELAPNTAWIHASDAWDCQCRPVSSFAVRSHPTQKGDAAEYIGLLERALDGSATGIDQKLDGLTWVGCPGGAVRGGRIRGMLGELGEQVRPK